MDWKDIIIWSRKHWYLYIISFVVCFLVGGVYYIATPVKRQVRATIMLRQTNDNSLSAQDEMLKIMGMGGSRVASDEIEILTSYTLVEQVVRQLNLTETYYKRGRMYYECQYPQHDITVVLPDTFNRNADIDIKIKEDGRWKIKISGAKIPTVSLTLDGASDNVKTEIGYISFIANAENVKGHYKVKKRTLHNTVEKIRNNVHVSRLSKESNIIELTAISGSPGRTSAIINSMLDIYNRSYVSDKNLLSKQTEQFLSDRLNIIAAELDNAEMELESYKRQYRIASISSTAESYRDYSEQYQRQVAEVNSEMDILDFILTQLNNPERENNILPSNIGIEDDALQEIILSYNKLILNRNKLRQNANNDNPSVISVSEQILETRRNLTEGITQSRQSMSLRRAYLEKQQKQYESLLSSLPEQERRYIEMQRDKETKEKQYLYLVTKREENAMLMAAEALPAKIIDYAQAADEISSPNIKFVIFFILVVGLFFPLCIYLFQLMKTELI